MVAEIEAYPFTVLGPEMRGAIRLVARLARVAERACQEVGVSLPQYRLLVSVSGAPQRASELAARVGVSRPTLTALVDGLEQASLLSRCPVPGDRRGICLECTPEGEEAVDRAEVSMYRRFLQLVDPAVGDSLTAAVSATHAALDREGERALGSLRP